MKSLTNYINEKLIVNKNYNPYTYAPKSFDELRKIIEDRYDKLGPGTKQDPIDFNDIDVSNLDSLCKKYKYTGIGLFAKTKFKYIDISDWDVSSVRTMSYMFVYCKELKSVGDLSNWDVSSVTDMSYMFCECKELESVGDISKWDVSKVTNMSCMFYACESFNQDISKWDVSSVTDMSWMFYNCKSFNQDISNWNVSNVTDMYSMFYECESFNQDISNWDVSKVKFKTHIFLNCPIKEEYKPKFK